MTDLLNGFSTLLSPTLFVIMAIGVIVGIIFGAVPGLSSSMAIAIFLPVTYSMAMNESFALLVALYIGAISGSLISAILINIPGSAQSIATCYDGHPMAASGHAQRALGIGVFYSFIGTVFSIIIMVIAAPPLAAVAVKMGSIEFFSMTFFALTMVSGVSGKNIFKGLVAAFLGIALSLVGLAPVDGVPRYTFGIVGLSNGFSVTPVVIGMFAMTEMMKHFSKRIAPDESEQREREKIRGFGFSIREFFEQTKNFFISAITGLVLGFLPGLGGSLANQIAYVFVKKSSKHPEKFGTGIMDGLVASETANNASIGGAMIPLLALGIPGDGATTMLMGAFTIHGLAAGPMLFKTNGDLVNFIFAAMIVCSVLMLIFEFFGLRVFAKIIEVPREILYPVVLTVCIAAAYAVNRNMFDVWCLFAFGILGVLMAKFEIPRQCFILGFVLGKSVETYLRRGIQLTRGSFIPFFTKPVSCIFLLATAAILISTVWKQFAKSNTAKG